MRALIQSRKINRKVLLDDDMQDIKVMGVVVLLVPLFIFVYMSGFEQEVILMIVVCV